MTCFLFSFVLRTLNQNSTKPLANLFAFFCSLFPDLSWYNYMSDTSSDDKYKSILYANKQYDAIGAAKHKRKYRFFCSCGRAFNAQKYINFHKRWECGRIIQCSICFRKFNTKSYYSLHMRKQHPDVVPTNVWIYIYIYMLETLISYRIYVN